ncbi:MAG: DUF4352 domain-containing protein [Actinomycetota bacterium]|nr:DUF4352 domain-containing protein [Actinomycetota bacterium]
MKKLLKWAGIIVGVLIIIGIVASLSGNGEEVKTVKEAKEEVATEETVKEEPAEKPEPKDIALKIGETGQGKNWDYTVNSFEVKDELSQKYGDPIKAGEGQKFLIVNITFKNKTKETKDITFWGSFDFKALAAGDYIFDECSDFEIMVALENDYGDIGDVAPGGSATGDIAFKISAGATDLQFKIGFDDLIWDLQ